MPGSVDGLVSGMSTSDVISQLMQVESVGQKRLQAAVKSQQTVSTAYQSINSRLATLRTAAEAMTIATGWQAAKATSSSTAVVATATSDAPSNSVTLNVTSLATAHVMTAEAPAAGPVVTGGNISIKVGTADPVAVPVTTNTAQGTADAINAAGLGVRAAVVTTDQGSMLQLTATKTGTAAAFTITGGLAGSAGVAVQAEDAKVAVGQLGAGGYTVTSATNTFSNVLPGVTFTAVREEDNVTISVAPEADMVAAKVQAIVDAANNALAEVDKQTRYDSTSKTGGPLVGNFTARQVGQQLLSTVSAPKDGADLNALGIELDSKGRLTFDKAKFVSAYQDDPDATKAAFTAGFAAPIRDVAKASATNVTAAITGGENLVRDLNGRIANWDVRLKARQDALQRQFANLEVALGKMKSQSSWLSGQIAGLPSGG